MTAQTKTVLPLRDLTKSNAQFRRAVKRLPLGVSSTFRYWGDDRTVYVDHGKGGRIWDIDGNGYIDHRLAYGPTILGYADDRVDAAARRGMEVGGVFALSTERELVVADRIAKMVPAAELVRFSNSGTEAVMAALRLARAHTGREQYLLVEGGYHGLFDAAMWMADVEDWKPGSNDDPEMVPYGKGIPPTVKQLAHLVPMNDMQRLEDTFKRHGDKLAAMLIEPIQGNCCAIMARVEYVRLARDLCDRHGVMLIIDEVKSGFRVGKGGIQGLMGVVPDITTFAKAVGNGYPIALVAGREEVMRSFGHGGASHGGTYTAHSVSLAAAEECLRILDETPALETLAGHGRALMAGISRILDARGIVHSYSGHPSMFGLFFDAVPPDNYRAWKTSDYTFYDTMAGYLHDLGIIVEPDSREPWFMCEAHGLDASCLSETLAAVERAVDLTVEELAAQDRAGGEVSFDAVIIGAGHNGLVTACYLARAGMKVCVVEKNDWIGGAAVSRELYPGFTYSNCSYVSSLFRPEIMRDLELAKHGLQILPYEGGAVFQEGGGYLGMFRDHDANRREFARHSPRDAEAYDLYARDILRFCRFIRPMLMRTPPDPSSFRPRDLSELLWLGKQMGALSEGLRARMVQFWTMSIADFLDEYFESPVIKGYLAVSAIIGTALGPMSPGSAYVLLHHYMGDVDGNVGAWGFARGGMGSITRALTASLKAAGGEVRVGQGVEKILVSGGRAVGVVLANGDEVRGSRVISNMDVKRTFLKHVDEAELPGAFVKRVKAFKIRGSSGKLNIALDAAPVFPALPEGAPNIKGDLHFTDSVERMERGYDDWKSGHFSRDPFQDVMIPTMIDPTMTPPGKHFMSCFVQYAPPKIAGREWSDADRDAFRDTCLDQIASYSPGFKNRVLHVEVRTPRELESEVGLTEGNIFQGELTFDQLLFNRPVPGYAQYRSPIRGLWMCGSSTHPGGGVMGAPGRNAAAEVLREAGRKGGMSDAYAVL